MKKVMITGAFAALISAFAVTPLISAPGDKPTYGMAGCGLGSIVFGTKTQVLAATTNGSSYNQFFGITSGTSNCVPGGGTAFNLHRQEVFVHVNYDSLEQEMAVGKGEKLAAFATLLGCPAGQLDTFGTLVKKEHSRFFSNKEDPSAMLKEVRNSIQADQNLSNACKI